MNSLRLSAVCWLVAAFSAVAHPISMSNAVANVREDEVLVELRIMLEDLVLFHSLKADAQTLFKAEDLRKAAVSHDSFLLKHFTLRDGNGEVFKGEVQRRDLSAIPDKGIPQAELMKLHAVYLMRYVPPKKKPKFITVLQQFGGTKAVVPSVMDFMTLQNGVWQSKPTQLQHSRPHTVAFDWENPPTEAPKNWRELRKKREEELQRQLGITSYTGLYSYIYLNDREVRHEILVPLLTFEKWLPIKRANPEFLEVEEQDAMRGQIAEWFRNRNPVEIDGIPVKPVLQRLQFFGLDIQDFAQNAKPRRISAYQARLGIILSYPAKAPPTRVNLTWEVFHESAPFLRSIVYDRNAKPSEEFFVKDQPRFEWVRKGPVPVSAPFKLDWDVANSPTEIQQAPAIPKPEKKGGQNVPNIDGKSTKSTEAIPQRISKVSYILIGIGFAGAAFTWMLYRNHPQRIIRSFGILTIWLFGAFFFRNHIPDADQTTPTNQITSTNQIASTNSAPILDLSNRTAILLQNIYRAYDYGDPSDVYDALEHSITGDLLEELFLKIRSGLRMQEQGGAIANVQNVKISSIKRVPNAGATFHCTWNVTGTVEHWGHIHTRENQYSANITLDITREGRGRISEFEVTNEKRVRFETGLRLFDDG